MSVAACNFLIWMLFLFSVALQLKSDLGRLELTFLDHTQLDIHTHPVGLLWTSDQLVAQAATFTTQQTQGTDIHASGGFRTDYPKNPAAKDLRIKPHGNRYRLLFCFNKYIMWQWPQAIYMYICEEKSLATCFWISGPSKTVSFACKRLLHKFECLECCTHWRLLK